MHTTIRALAPATVLALVLVVAGCDGGNGTGTGIQDDQFITTVAELRRAAQVAGTDTMRFEAMRQEILERNGVTEAQLRAFAESPGRDLDDMTAIWDSIAVRLTDTDDGNP